MKTLRIPTYLIDEPTLAHRQDFDPEALYELANSIKRDGLINNLLVIERGERFEVKAGHRRLLACRLAQVPEVLCNVLTPEENARGERMKFAENLERRDLSPLEEAAALQAEMATTDCTVQDLSTRTNRSVDWVKQRLELLTLPDDLQQRLQEKAIPLAHALALAKVTDAVHRKALTDYAAHGGATIAIVRAWVDQWKLEATRNPEGEYTQPPPFTPGETPTITIPCWMCEAPHNYAGMHLVRVCPACSDHCESLKQGTAT